ncbi:MAG: hypothetical protein JNK15_05220 [Planctomycetes bacterium]|nr:hypothetical protein [Planctomycetota bacterium]
MNLFADNDVIAKLAAWDLLDAGIKACGLQVANVRYLPSAPFVLGVRGKMPCKYPPVVQERLRALFASAQQCGDSRDDALADVVGIDPGDSILLSQSASTTSSFLMTGDKKCIRAVVAEPRCAVLVTNLRERVFCLEQVLLRAISQITFDEVKRRVVESGLLTVDTAVAAAFGSGLLADQLNACGALEQRVQALAAVAGGMLVPHPFTFLGNGFGNRSV